MRKSLVWIGLVTITLLSSSMAAAQGKADPASLPASLDAFFPPKAQQPVYLFHMLDLGTRFSAIVADIAAAGPGDVKADFDRFAVAYSQVSKSVPEWRDAFPAAPVEELRIALAGSHRGAIMAAYEKVGRVCHDCHVRNMPAVEQKYHWPDFAAVKVRDPLTNEDVPFNRLMKFIDANFAGISVSAERGQRDVAQKQFEGFKARFAAMKKSCISCHDTERKYYVDESVESVLDKLGRTLEAPAVDVNAVEAARQQIGTASCFKCHLTHVPAAMAKLQTKG